MNHACTCTLPFGGAQPSCPVHDPQHTTNVTTWPPAGCAHQPPPLSRRDWIAGMALQGQLASKYRDVSAKDNAEYALETADRLIALLDLPPSP